MFCQNGIRNLDFIRKGMSSKKKVLFILPSLKAGGAERVMTFVANNLNADLFDVTILIIGFEKDAVYEFNSKKAFFLDRTSVSSSVFDIIQFLKIQRPDIVISAISHLNALMAFLGLFFTKIRFIGREASVITNMKEYAGFKFKINYYLIKISYKLLDIIICQSEDMFDDFATKLKIDKKKLILIHNPITKKGCLKRDKEFSNVTKYVTVGRLSEEKGHLRLLEALSKVKTKNFEYTIIGTGPLEETLKKEVLRLNLNKNVFFLGETKQIYAELVKHDIFLQGSFVEGFPNGLLEAMSVGIPAIAFEAPGGTKEIIINSINGFIVKDIDELVSLINRGDLNVRFDRKKIVLSVESRFSANTIVNKYENLFLNK